MCSLRTYQQCCDVTHPCDHIARELAPSLALFVRGASMWRVDEASSATRIATRHPLPPATVLSVMRCTSLVGTCRKDKDMIHYHVTCSTVSPLMHASYLFPVARHHGCAHGCAQVFIRRSTMVYWSMEHRRFDVCIEQGVFSRLNKISSAPQISQLGGLTYC